MSRAETRGYAAIRRAGHESREEKVAKANERERERRGGNGRPYQKHWVQRGTSSN